MKKLLYALIIVAGSLATPPARAQYNRYGLAPDLSWLPEGYRKAIYYFFPDIDVYYYVPAGVFVSFNEAGWVSSHTLPGRFGEFDLGACYKIGINDPRPFAHNAYYMSTYAAYRNPQYQPAPLSQAAAESDVTRQGYNNWYQNFRQNNEARPPQYGNEGYYQNQNRPSVNPNAPGPSRGNNSRYRNEMEDNPGYYSKENPSSDNGTGGSAQGHRLYTYPQRSYRPANGSDNTRITPSSPEQQNNNIVPPPVPANGDLLSRSFSPVQTVPKTGPADVLKKAAPVPVIPETVKPSIDSSSHITTIPSARNAYGSWDKKKTDQ